MAFFFAASGWQTLITLVVIILLSVISSWLKRRQERREEDLPSEPGPRPRRPLPPAASWEEELRRILEGKESETPRPPPVILAEPPRPAPPPLPPPPKPVTARRPVEPNEEDIGLPVPLPTLSDSARAHRRASQLGEQMNERMRQRSAMAESTVAYQRAQQLDAKVAGHLKHLTENVSSYTVEKKRSSIAPEILHAKAMLHDRASIRSALVASMILGPPKALEN